MSWLQSGHYVVNVFHLVGGFSIYKIAQRTWLRTLPLGLAAAAVAYSLHSCLSLCGPMDYSLPGSSVHGTEEELKVLDFA